MSALDHMKRVRKLALQAMDWEAQDDGPVCHDFECRCPTCGMVNEVIRGNMVARGWSREDTKRITTAPAAEGASYPYIASVRVDGQEVYRVLKDLAEVLDGDVLDDINAAMERNEP